MKKQWICLLLSAVLLTACRHPPNEAVIQESDTLLLTQAVKIELSDEMVLVDGEMASTNSLDAVYTANDIIYYEAGKDFTYGEGSELDAHSAEEAATHTVIHITQPGTYALSGKITAGQIAVDLGDGAEEDSDAVVTLILNGVDITNTVAPAVIFYRVYECSNTDTENATKDVDTTAAGANIIIADDTVNTINGSYVARIYKPDSVELSEDGAEVADAKKLHKYDAAFYSKMTMNVDGGSNGTGELRITAENEGLDSELHLTINGGNIDIHSGNDGINTNEDGVSVTTINGGKLAITVTGETGEGDGIDSNGWLVINGGEVYAYACSNSADSGIDSDMGIHINGGTVIASGHMLDRIEEGGQNYVVFTFNQTQSANSPYTIKSEDDHFQADYTPENAFSILLVSHSELTEGMYSIWNEAKQLAVVGGNGMMHPGGGMGDGFRLDGTGEAPMMPPNKGEEFDPSKKPEFPGKGDLPEDRKFSKGQQPPERSDQMSPPEGYDTNWTPPGEQGARPNDSRLEGNQSIEQTSDTFGIQHGGTYVSVMAN